ncbi:MAG: GGDEF domain-containing protein [Xanthobacteraceae bacterium]|jgi:diguanylate cyclase
MKNDPDFERTIGLADSAIERIRALGVCATPHNFEIWYTYGSGQNAALNAAINNLLNQQGSVTQLQHEEIYLKYFSAAEIGERIDKVGTQMAGEIEQVMAMISAAIGNADDYSRSLAGASAGMAGNDDREHIRIIVESLISATREVENKNHEMQQRLTDSRQEIRQLQENLEVVRTESLTDPLTTLANRKFFDNAIERLIREASDTNEPLAVILTDIDHFKKFNDTYGHLTGDQVLRLVAQSLKHNVKGQDVAARYGGEEFAVVLPKTTLASAVTVADHIRRAVQSKELMRRSTGETLGRVTISLGVSTWHHGDDVGSLIGRADSCLYAAKAAGRNCVIAETALDMRNLDMRDLDMRSKVA